MASAFRPISALIEVDFPWREPSPKVLRHPSAHEPHESRIVFHETVHYWQQLAQGFLARIVEEDWGRLLHFEQDGEAAPAGQYRRELVRRHDYAGFSAQDLQESLARFWDVHVIGPHRLLELEFEDPRRDIDSFLKEQYFAFKNQGMIAHPVHGGYSDLAFNMAMEAAAGNYARPYEYVRKRMNGVASGTAFPLAGHFALQTDKPVEVFLATIDAVAPRLERLPRGKAIHDLWVACYALVRDEALRRAKALGAERLALTAAVVHSGALREHPVYRWILQELERGRVVLEDTRFAADVTRPYRNAPPELRGVFAIDCCLACPGYTLARSFLVEWLAPPCVAFATGETWFLPDLHRRELVPEVDESERRLSEERQEVAEGAVDVQKRWQAFVRAARGY